MILKAGACIRTVLMVGAAAVTSPMLAADAAVGVSLGWGDVAQLFAGLGLVVVMIVALAWALRRLGGLGTGGTGPLQVLGGLSVGPRERVVLLRAGEQQLLLGVAPGRVQTLHIFNEPLATPPAGGDGFAARLQKAMSSRSDSSGQQKAMSSRSDA